MKRLLAKGRGVGGRAMTSARRRIDLTPVHGRVTFYVIGDIHGCFDLLLHAEARILDDAARGRHRPLIVYLGDYVDRGPRSGEVIEHLMGTSPHLRRLALCGNHDQMFLAALEGRADPTPWLSFGGKETLASYGIQTSAGPGRAGLSALMKVAEQAVPPHHLDFLRQLPILAQSAGFVFVHAGVRPGIPLAAQRDDDLLWIREPFLELGPQLPVTVVHGHTIVHMPEFGKGRIGIDTGAFATGRLSILKIDGDDVSVL